MKKEPIRILHVIGSMNRGGAETMIMNFYRTIDREKVQFDFVENTSDPAAFDSEIKELGGRIFRCPHYNGRNHIQYVNWWKTFFCTHRDEYTAVHGHLGSTAAIYLCLAKKAGIYTIAHSHNTSDFSLMGIVYRIYAYPTRYIADFFFGCSRDAGISRYGRKICGSNKFAVLNNAIDINTFGYSEEIRSQMRHDLGVENKIVIGHVGRFLPQKNHRFLINIFKAVHKKNRNAVLLLVGDGTLRGKIERQVRDAELTESVIFAGVQQNVNDYYQAMDVFVFPSVFEGLGIVAVEAQTSGLPCVISDKVSRECIVTDNLVEIHKLADSPDEWAKTILEKAERSRKDCSAEVKRSGYEIHEEVIKLQKFYLGIGS